MYLQLVDFYGINVGKKLPVLWNPRGCISILRIHMTSSFGLPVCKVHLESYELSIVLSVKKAKISRHMHTYIYIFLYLEPEPKFVECCPQCF